MDGGDVRQARLNRAMKSVREYFSGREVNENTVLAAYLRSNGLPASGQPWEAAKRAMRTGADFGEAVRAAAATQAAHAAPAPVSANEAPTPFSGPSLAWFPKQFGPGDIDGVGAKRLLGTPNTEPPSVLVRETGQNSWDARGTTPSIDFVLNLRRLPHEVVGLLRRRVFTGDAPRTDLAKLLHRDEVWALEVSDRGTVGLGGPIRNDLAVDAGEDTNFIDLVFNIGAPRDVHLGGGTYGFGKTIAYVVSSVGTVLIWSRCEGGRGQEHRLIGSAIGDGFNMNGLRYTGRHWWGNAIFDEDRVEPVVGELAEELGGLVFATGFEEDATGTSILILDPQFGGDSREEDVQLLADAVVWNLWPKLLADQSGHSRMRIDVQLDGESIDLPCIEDHPVLSGHAQCLMAVRATQSGQDPSTLPSRYPVEVQEIWCKLPRTLLGHLALTRYPAPQGAEASHAVTLMRNQAELVVKTFEGAELDVEGFQWAGVFKPVAAVDDSFAMAEPPAHDDWVPTAVPDKRRRREVNVAKRRIKEATDEYLSPRGPSLPDQEAPPSAAHVGDLLADLLGGLEGPAPSTRRGQRHATRATRPRVDIVGATHEPAADLGWTLTTIDVELANGGASGALVDATVRVGVDGGSWEDDQVVRVVGWQDGPGGDHDTGPQLLAPGSVRRFVYEARSDLAIDFATKLVED